MKEQKMTRDKVDKLCKKHVWFTDGSDEQYENMLTRVDEGASIHEVAMLICEHSPLSDCGKAYLSYVEFYLSTTLNQVSLKQMNCPKKQYIKFKKG